MAIRNRRRGYTRSARTSGRGRPMTAKGRRIRRGVLSNQPTFVETFQLARDNLQVPVGGTLGKYFKVRIQDVPQVASYSTLYTQYRINWVKVMLLPSFNTMASDFNSAEANLSAPHALSGQARIVYSIQDSPGQTDPATELEVLEDNGCKIKPMGPKWSCSFKPVADVVETNGAGGVIPVKQSKKQWFNFDTATPANNPFHGGVKAFISLPGVDPAPSTPTIITWYAYYKVSFTLRDPQ